MFLTRLPCPGWCDHHPGYLMRGMAYFPVLGALIGVWAAAFYDAAASIWPPLVAAAMSSGGTLWLTGCFHEDGLCDTLDGFGGGWTKAQIMKIMRDSRNGSYATMGGCLWVLAKAAAIAHLAEIGPAQGSTWLLGGSQGAGPAIIVAQAAARASSAVLIYFYDYVVDDEDAKGEYYNWYVLLRGTLLVACGVSPCVRMLPGTSNPAHGTLLRGLENPPVFGVGALLILRVSRRFGDSKRLLGFARVLFSAASAGVVSCAVLPLHDACRVLMAALAVTCVAGAYGQSVLGGVMGDFLGATICMAEVPTLARKPATLPPPVPSAASRLVCGRVKVTAAASHHSSQSTWRWERT